MAEDRPVIVGGAPHMITVQFRDSSADNQRRTFTVTPVDPDVPFKAIVITDGPREVFRFSLTEDWKITIV